MTTLFHTQGTLGTYYDRWDALDKLIASSYAWYEDQPAFPRQDTVLYLLQSLREFAAGQFQFFYFGYGPEEQARPHGYPVLLPDAKKEYPPEDILTGILEQIGHDLELIRNAADDRLVGDANAQQTLADADKLAWLAIKPAIDYAALEESTTVLTYFDKAAEFYRIPYAQVALIAIPLTCTSPSCREDFLAIPHEAGHYVYRHVTGDAQTHLSALRKQIAGDPLIHDEYKGWLSGIFEELFADIYGCLIAGPVMAVDFERLALANSRTKFRNGDGSHPNPALRPLVYCQVLQNSRVGDLTDKVWPSLGKELSDKWQTRLDNRGDTEFGVTTTRDDIPGQQQVTAIRNLNIRSSMFAPDGSTSRPIDGPVAYAVQKIADKILEAILVFGEVHRPTRYTPGNLVGWAGKLTAETKSADLMSDFECNLEVLLDQIKLRPPEADPTSVRATGRQPRDDGVSLVIDTSSVRTAERAPVAYTSQFWIEWVMNANGPMAAWPPEAPIESGNVLQPAKGDKLNWGYILWADGWTTEGPSQDPGHPET